MQSETHRTSVMLSPVLLLISVSVSSCCRTAPVTECSQPPFVPGHNLVGEGFDIVRMKTMGAFVVNVQDYVTGGVHGNCTICKNSLLGREEKLPSAVTDWRVKVNCKRSISARVFESTSSVLQQSTSSTSVGWKVGLGLPMVAGVAVGGTHSKSSTFARSHASQDKFFYTRHQFSCHYYTLRVKAHPPLTKEFMHSVKSLPPVYNSQSESSYHHFISVYGTHYLRQVNLGGRVLSTTAVRTCQIAMKGLSVRDVSNCLSAEASAVIKGIEVKGKANYCKSKSNKLENKNGFSASFSDRVTEVWGGSGGSADLLFSPDKQHGYTAWMKTLQTVPGVVSYTLTSLHMLVMGDSARKEALRKAICQYVMKNAMSLSCSSKCKIGHRSPECACKCSGHQNIDSNCCPSHPGVATLTVKVERATGLWGDYFSKTDGYVKVFYGKRGETTPVIMNNDFPVWNYDVRFGTVNLAERQRLYLEVWDRDNKWDDNLLGKVDVIPTQGVNMKKQFRLKHGTLFVSITAVCGPNLQGAVCERYAPAPEAERLLTYPELLQNQRLAWIEENYRRGRNISMI
ncbi:perforin-1.3 [Ictalurus punctatus]|uniref:Perforin-1.3 n=1 Tax=Ictalurus punctatus TaxID=7998 RepID=A0A2D0PV49_ICTPU|nr:perforin-1.3 [Ictalurus punctatus]